tara:strand:+ start:277 stop:591 length:315 start_codon:yes stop_codon:yes gene_type:complete
MKKLFKIIYIKRIIYLSLAVSWVYFLIIMVAIKDDLTDISYNFKQLDNIDTKLNAIDDKLKYDFSSVYKGRYDGIKHFRFNRETGKIEGITNYGGWGSSLFGPE